MILSRVEFGSFVYSASFAVIPAQYTSIPGASEGKSERTKTSEKQRWREEGSGRLTIEVLRQLRVVLS
jgi:hypothetical protein